MKPKPITEADLIRWRDQYGGWAAAARGTGIPAHRIYNAASKLNVLLNESDGEISEETEVTGEDVRLISEDTSEWNDMKAMLAERGLNPDEWFIKGGRVNLWGGKDGDDNSQLRVDITPRLGMLMPAKTEGWKPPKPTKADKTNDGLIVCLGDHHAPRHSRPLHDATCKWLEEFKPERGIILGDLLDFDQLSRHRATPEWSDSVQSTINAGYNILRSYITASPGTKWQMLDGNHEERMRNKVIDNLWQVFGITRAQTEESKNEPPVLSTPNLLRLDELGIEWENPHGGYEHAQIKLTSELAARHGWIASKGSGTSALKTLNHLRYSIIFGHTHRQSIVYHTAHSIDGEPKTLLGCEAGTMAEIEGGLGYANAPDWQMGFATAQIYPEDGTFKVDLATFVNDTLMWHNWRCRPSKKSRKK